MYQNLLFFFANLLLNIFRYHWMYSATAYNHAYGDTGLFCIHASAPPAHVRSMVEVVTRELVQMATEPGKQELNRAKTQLQSMLLMNLEARPVVFEDIGRQVLATGTRKRPEYFIKAIGNSVKLFLEYKILNDCNLFIILDAIQAEDIQRIARRFLTSPPSLAARGQIKGLPEVKDIQSGLLNNDGRLPSNRRLSLFR